MKLIALTGVAGSGKDTFYRFLAAYNHASVCYKFAHPLQDAVAILGGFYSSDGSHRRWFEDRDWKGYYRVNLSQVHVKGTQRRERFAQISRIICGGNPELKKPNLRLVLPQRTWSGEEVQETLEQWFDVVLPQETYSPREVQRLFGNDLCRKYIHQDVWVQHMRQRLEKEDVTSLVVITDLRFPNELELIREWHGKVVYLECIKAWNTAKLKGLLEHESESHYEYLKSQADAVYDNSGSLGEIKQFAEEVHREWFGW